MVWQPATLYVAKDTGVISTVLMAGTRSRIYVRPIATAYMYMHVSNSLYDKHSLTMPSAASDAASASRPAVGMCVCC